MTGKRRCNFRTLLLRSGSYKISQEKHQRKDAATSYFWCTLFRGWFIDLSWDVLYHFSDAFFFSRTCDMNIKTKAVYCGHDTLYSDAILDSFCGHIRSLNPVRIMLLNLHLICFLRSPSWPPVVIPRLDSLCQPFSMFEGYCSRLW